MQVIHTLNTNISIFWSFMHWCYSMVTKIKYLANYRTSSLVVNELFLRCCLIKIRVKSYNDGIIHKKSKKIWTKRTFIWFQINRKMVNTIWFRVDLIIFRKYFSVCICTYNQENKNNLDGITLSVAQKKNQNNEVFISIFELIN